MQACPTEENILAFVEGRLQPVERSLTESHVASCDSCGALLAAVAGAWHAEGRLRAPSTRERSRLAPGQQLGPYAVLAHAGSGAMGDVYRARDPRLGRDVALKVLPAHLAQEPMRLARFRQEARAAGALSHPHLLRVFDVGVHEGTPYLVSEWLEGRTLRAQLAQGALSREATLQLGVQLARGLAAAHERGIVHRDIKPANIFLCEDGGCRLLDFGLAKLVESVEDEEPGTRSGEVLGTVGYMAPEQIRGEAVDPRADLFGLCAVLYEACAGRPPFAGGSAGERLGATLRDEPPALEGELGRVLARGLAKAPSQRFQSAQDLAFVLESLRDGGSTDAARSRLRLPRPPVAWRRPALLAFGVLGLLGAGALLSWRLRPAAASAERPQYRPMTFRRGHVLSARFSQDGHTVVYGAAWDGKPAQLFSARTERPIPQPLGLGADVLGTSPTGELAVLLSPRTFDADHGSGTLAQVPLAGGAPRPVLEEVLEADWGDGQLAVVRREGGRFRLEHPVGRVRFESEGWISHARVAPRGGRIAFLLHPNAKDDRGAVMLLEGEGPPRELSAGWASVRGLAWAPGGDEVWFTGSRTDVDYALYAVRPGGEPRLVDRVPGRVVLQDIARSGAVLLDHQALRTGMVFGRGGEERELTLADGSFFTYLSPDGRTLLFTEMSAGEGASYGAYLGTTDGAPPVRLGDGIPYALSPDGRWALTLRYGDEAQLSLLPTGPGAARQLSMAPLQVLLGARFFPDGERLLLRGSAPGRPARWWVQGLAGGPAQPLTEEGFAPEAVLSPDGERLAAVDEEGGLRLIPTRGGAPEHVPGRFAEQSVVGWEAGGAALYLRSISLPVRVSRVELRTGALTPHLSLPARLERPGLVSVLTLSLSADGTSYAYSYNEVLSRLFLVEGLAGAAPLGGGP
ncbi:protein kinase [Aggregicoccus sp. 17bor-14]|uniref:serine/threonine-protein kinase n=1 Tax=Myxococcaceae TaxID=31 RepID=UPI00129C76DC|nr:MULTISPECIES: serine/threonine-protein kinase [Myxococcaceae]MBF5042195.1 protein kinase [Simulacricoccus sp. 17bor-14]MRI87971.1 protein kinase [Aggregicoccus sp. 17bor-14]